MKYIKNDYQKINNKNLAKTKIYKNINYDNYNKYINMNNFDDLFRKKRSNISVTTSPTSSSKPSTPISVNVPTNTGIQGKSPTAADLRWSPVSSSGIIYEWDRGVIGIPDDGTLVKIKIDGTEKHHADVTKTIGNQFGITNIRNTPFAAAVDVANAGVVIIQTEGDNCFVYLPVDLTMEQTESLRQVVEPRNIFNFSYIHDGDIVEEQSYQQIIDFSKTIIKPERKAISF